MHTLWFVKFEAPARGFTSDIVIQFTLPEGATEHTAREHGLGFIAEPYRALYRCTEATRVCRTLDVVLYHEPC